MLRRFQQADVLVHSHFSEALQRRIDAFGRARMRRSVGELRRLTGRVYSVCQAEEAGGGDEDVLGTKLNAYEDVVVFKVT